MQFVKRLLIGAGAVMLVAVVLMVAAPRTVRAVVATLIRDIDNPGRATQVVQYCRANSGVGGFFNCTPDYTVPANDRLVIQQVEGNCTTPQGNTLANALFVVNSPVADQYGNTQINHQLPLVNEGSYFWGGPSVHLLFVNSQAVNYYADPGSTFTFFADTNDLADNTTCFFQFSGYLISYP
jgi:hypothetical protein